MASVMDPAGHGGETDERTLQGGAAPPEGGTAEASNGKPVFKPTRSFYLAFGALMALMLSIAIDATVLSAALPTISSALGGTALQAFWAGTGYLLASTVLQPTVASLSNIFGRKYMVYVSAALFAAGSLVDALAHNFTVLLVGRTIQGVGGGGILSLSEVIITDLVPLAFRGQWFSLMSAVWAVGSVTGPLIGAGFSQDVTWRWIFYINLPITGLGVFFIVLFLNQAKIPGQIFQKLGRFDWGGSFLFTAASTSFLFGLTTGGVMYPWSSWRVLLPLIIGPFIMVGFAFYELHVATEPIVDKGIFNNRDMIITYILSAFHGSIVWALVYFLTLYYQGVKLYSPVISGVAILPETLTVGPVAGAVGFGVAISGHYRWSIWGGWALTTLGAGILLLLKPSSSIAAWVFLNLPIGIGTGMLFPALAISVQAACEPALNGHAAAFFSFIRTFGQAVGVAVSGVIFQNVLQRKLAANATFAPVADQYSRDATILVGLIKRMAPSPERTQLITAYNDSLRTIWQSLIAFSAFSLVLCLFVRGYTLNQEHVTKQAFVEGEKRAPSPGEKDLEASKA